MSDTRENCELAQTQALEEPGVSVEWCGPPADDSGLSAGAIAGIAVGAVLVVVAAGVVLL